MPEPSVTIVVPNLNRKDQLQQTLQKLADLNELPKQIVVVDNGSTDGADRMVERQFPSVELVRLAHNVGTAARNVALEHAKAPVTLMLDNDSYPAPGTLKSLFRQFEHDRHLGVLACRVKLLTGPHEAGGLPGVFIGCGAAMRTDLIRRLGGYPEHFGYYVEEYDLACRVWQSGHRVRWHYDSLVYHVKSPAQRNMNRILYFLTRNNLRLWHRYCPPQRRGSMLRETMARYALIAHLERARRGYVRGLTAGLLHIARNYRSRKELTSQQFDALFGRPAMEEKLRQLAEQGITKVAVFGWGKGIEQIVQAARTVGIDPTCIIAESPLPIKHWQSLPIVPHGASSPPAETILAGSLSPGVALDFEAEARRRWPNANVIRLADLP